MLEVGDLIILNRKDRFIKYCLDNYKSMYSDFGMRIEKVIFNNEIGIIFEFIKNKEFIVLFKKDKIILKEEEMIKLNK